MEWSLGSFGDVRLDKGGKILERMVALKTVCLRRLGGNRGGELRAGRFFANPKACPCGGGGNRREDHRGMERSDRCCCRRAACAGDQGHHGGEIPDHRATSPRPPPPASAGACFAGTSLGPVKKGNTYGVVAHVMIAVDADSHACLGLVGGDVRTRDGVVTEHRRDRPLSERESRRWIETAERAKLVPAKHAPAEAGGGG